MNISHVLARRSLVGSDMAATVQALFRAVSGLEVFMMFQRRTEWL